MKSIATPSPGFYRCRLRKGGPWQPALIRVENSRDDENRVADRPRLVLHLDGKRYERGEILRFWPGLWPISEAEFHRLNVTIAETGGQSLNSIAPRF